MDRNYAAEYRVRKQRQDQVDANAAEMRENAAAKRECPYIAELDSDWHGVPAGTRVRVVAVTKDWQGNTIASIEREDGEKLPGPVTKQRRVAISAAFLVSAG